MEKTGLTPTDELIRRAIIGDAAAFTRLWDTNIDVLRIYIRTTIKNLDDFYVEDICSKSFQKAFRQIGSFDSSRSQFATWLKVIARRTALDTVAQLRRMKENYVSITDENINTIDTMGDGDPDLLETIIGVEDSDRTRELIEGLPSLYREIARMRMVEGCQYKEIADELGMELNTVRTRIRRAKALIDKMKEDL